MAKLTTIFVAAVFAMAATTTLQAQCDGCDSGCAACAAPTCCSAPGCQAAGRCCGGPACIGKAEMVDVEKHCWEIETKDICVPAVRFPWERGGSKLTLCTLFKFKCDKGCDNPGCDELCCDGGCAAAPSCGCAAGGCDGGCAAGPSCGCASRRGSCSGCASGCDSCVAPKCGFIVSVRTLKKKTYDAQVCEYSIAPADGNGNGQCCDNPGCSSPGCAGCAAAPAYEMAPPTAAPQYEMAPAVSQPMAAVPQPVPAAPEPTAKSSLGSKLKFVSLKSRLFGGSSK